MVLISKQQKRMAYAYLLEEGVIVVKKDMHLKKHQVLDMPNLNLICIMRSLFSKKYVSECFCWNWYYYTVTKEGVKFLCQYLGTFWTQLMCIGVSEQVLPKTFKAPPKKIGEEETGREERRGYGERRGSKFGLLYKTK